jgi:hypothetical protein
MVYSSELALYTLGIIMVYTLYIAYRMSMGYNKPKQISRVPINKNTRTQINQKPHNSDLAAYNTFDNSVVNTSSVSSKLDASGGEFADALNQLIPDETMGVDSGFSGGSTNFSNDADLDLYNKGLANHPTSFAPTGDIASGLTPAMERDIIRDQLNNSRGSYDYDGINDLLETDDLTHLRNVTFQKTRPGTMQQFTRNLNPYGTETPEIDTSLIKYTGPQYVGCYTNTKNNDLLPKHLGEMTPAQCAASAETMGHKIYGLQFGEGVGEGRAECNTGNDEISELYGNGKTCNLIGDHIMGGYDTNAVYIT